MSSKQEMILVLIGIISVFALIMAIIYFILKKYLAVSMKNNPNFIKGITYQPINETRNAENLINETRNAENLVGHIPVLNVIAVPIGLLIFFLAIDNKTLFFYISLIMTILIAVINKNKVSKYSKNVSKFNNFVLAIVISLCIYMPFDSIFDDKVSDEYSVSEKKEDYNLKEYHPGITTWFKNNLRLEVISIYKYEKNAYTVIGNNFACIVWIDKYGEIERVTSFNEDWSLRVLIWEK